MYLRARVRVRLLAHYRAAGRRHQAQPRHAHATLNDKGTLEVDSSSMPWPRLCPGGANRFAPKLGAFQSIPSTHRCSVTYKVDATQVEQRTDLDKLILNVETN